MTESQSSSSGAVLESWEEAGERDIDPQLDQRHQQVQAQKQLHQLEMIRAKEAAARAAAVASGAGDVPTTQQQPQFRLLTNSDRSMIAQPLSSEGQQSAACLPVTKMKILRRPQSTGVLGDQSGSSAYNSAGAGQSAEEKGRMKSLEERKQAYAAARERIFGEKCDPCLLDTEPTSIEDTPPVYSDIKPPPEKAVGSRSAKNYSPRKSLGMDGPQTYSTDRSNDNGTNEDSTYGKLFFRRPPDHLMSRIASSPSISPTAQQS